jgi:hypothetical protein
MSIDIKINERKHKTKIKKLFSLPLVEVEGYQV